MPVKNTDQTLEPQVLDQQALAQLQQLGRNAGLDDFLARLARSSLEKPPAFSHWRRALAASDARALGSMAQSLRGTFGSLGAVRLAKYCSELERLAEQGDIERCGARLDALQQEYQRVETALRMISSSSWAPSC